MDDPVDEPTPKLLRFLLALCCFVATAAWVPAWVCGRPADGYFDGDLSTQSALARHVAARIVRAPAPTIYQTGRSRFDGQATVAAHQMALLGLGQVVLQHPDQRDRYLPAMRAAAARLVDPDTLAYAAQVYGDHGLEQMGAGEGHAYLGYINLGLGMLRAVDPDTRHAPLHDRLTERLEARLFESPTGTIETYPGETWPPDVAAVAGSIGLHAQVTGDDRADQLAAWRDRFARCAVDESGYLIQRLRSDSCEALDAPRGSGTAIAAYFLGFATPELALRLHRAIAERGFRAWAGFGAVREYVGAPVGGGDVNSGPVIAGMSIGATGFALGSAKLHGDRALFSSLYRTAHLFGAPVERVDGVAFAPGGCLGNALLLAMLTARTP